MRSWRAPSRLCEKHDGRICPQTLRQWLGGQLSTVNTGEPWEVPRLPCHVSSTLMGSLHVSPTSIGHLAWKVPRPVRELPALEYSPHPVLSPDAVMLYPKAGSHHAIGQWWCQPRPHAQSGSLPLPPETGKAHLPPDGPPLPTFLFLPCGVKSGQGQARGVTG